MAATVHSFILQRFYSIFKREYFVDDFVFRLHYKWTAPTLFGVLFLSFLYSVLEPMTCFTSGNDFPKQMLDAYCLMQNTFILPEHLADIIGEDVPFQGVDNSAGGARIYQKYYQWVPVFLMVQALLFYLPHWLWSKVENGNIESLIVDLDQPIIKLNGSQQLLTDEEMHGRVERVAEYLVSTRGKNRSYIACYLSLHFLNLINVCLQIYLTDLFLNGEFFSNGWQMLSLLGTEYDKRTDAMIAVFPRMAKCTIHQFGVAGSVQQHDALCILPFNFFYEMIFVYNLVWFTILAILNALCLLLWFTYCLCLPVRCFFLEVLRKGKASKKGMMKTVLRYFHLGDVFIIWLLAMNMSAVHYDHLIETLDSHEEVNSQIGSLSHLTLSGQRKAHLDANDQPLLNN